MQLTLCGVGVAEEHDVLLSTNLRTSISIWNDTHTFNTVRDAHLWVEDTTVGSKVHTTDVISGERCVLQLNPCLTLPEFVHDTGGIVGQHLVKTDVFGSLSHSRRGACQHDTAEQKFELIHVIVACIIILLCFLSAEKEYHNLCRENAKEHRQRVDSGVA